MHRARLAGLASLVWLAALSTAAEPLRVYVTIAPQADLVEQIGAEHVAIDTMIRPGRDPHTFEPTPRQVVALAKAKIYFTIGMPLERRLLDKIEGHSDQLAIVDTTRGIVLRTADVSCGHEGHSCGHDHGAHGDHSCNHAGHDHGTPLDTHVWLSPPLLKMQAKNIAAALEKHDPANRGDYRKNLGNTLGEIDRVDREITAALAPYRGESFYVYHAAFGYFGRAYGLKQEAIQVDGRSPSLRQLRAIIHQAKKEDVRILFLQPQFDQRGARIVADMLGGTVVSIDPLAKDVLGNLEQIAREIRRSFE